MTVSCVSAAAAVALIMRPWIELGEFLLGMHKILHTIDFKRIGTELGCNLNNA